MSKDFSFLKITPVSPNLPETIDLEQDHDERLVYIPADRAEDWQKNLGLKRKVSYRTIDFFEVGEKMYNKKVISVSWSAYENGPCFHFEDGLSATVSNNRLKPYYYTAEKDAYVYLSETVEAPDCLAFQDIEKYSGKILDVEDLIAMLEEIVAETDSDTCGVYANSMYAIGKCISILLHENNCYIVGDYC